MKILTILLTLLATSAHSLPVTPVLEVTDATVEGTPAGNSSRVSARIINPTSQSVVVTSLGSPLASKSRVILFSKDPAGLTTMTEQATLTFPPGETLLLPNVLEWRLDGLQTSLTDGTEIPLKLTFTNGTTRTYKAKVK